MRPATILCIFCVVFLGIHSPLSAQHFPTSQVAEPNSELFYRQALQAYLDGNYDEAILLAAKSVSKDPANKEVQNLLDLLMGEKDRAKKTEIWLSEKFPVKNNLESPDQISKNLSNKVSEDLKNDIKRIQVQSGHFKENSDAQYSRLQKSQAEVFYELEKQRSNLFFLYLFSGASLFLSLLAFWSKLKWPKPKHKV